MAPVRVLHQTSNMMISTAKHPAQSPNSYLAFLSPPQGGRPDAVTLEIKYSINMSSFHALFLLHMLGLTSRSDVPQSVSRPHHF
jgi:hypothetical protein